jgi:hypothetical protein
VSGQGSVERETGSQRGEEPRTHAAAARAGRAECAVHGLRSGQQRAREERGRGSDLVFLSFFYAKFIVWYCFY